MEIGPVVFASEYLGIKIGCSSNNTSKPVVDLRDFSLILRIFNLNHLSAVTLVCWPSALISSILNIQWLFRIWTKFNRDSSILLVSLTLAAVVLELLFPRLSLSPHMLHLACRSSPGHTVKKFQTLLLTMITVSVIEFHERSNFCYNSLF